MKCNVVGQFIKGGSFNTKSNKTIFWYCILPENDCNTVFINSIENYNFNKGDVVDLKVNCNVHLNANGTYSNKLDLWVVKEVA